MNDFRAQFLIFLSIFTIGGLAHAAERGSSPEVWGSALRVSPKVKYIKASMFGQGSVPAYEGFGYGGDVEYLIGTKELQIGPYFEIIGISLENSANNSAQKEVLEGTFTTIGGKLYTDYSYLKLGASRMRIKDRASGTVTNTKEFKSDGIEVGAGLKYAFSPQVSTTLGLDIAYFKLSPKDNNIESRLDYFSYAIVFGLRLAIPSGGSRRSGD